MSTEGDKVICSNQRATQTALTVHAMRKCNCHPSADQAQSAAEGPARKLGRILEREQSTQFAPLDQAHSIASYVRPIIIIIIVATSRRLETETYMMESDASY